MVKLISPAPGGWESLPFGSASPPYSPRNTHRGKDWGYYYAQVSSLRVVAPAGGVVRVISSDGSWNSGWGNRVEIVATQGVIIALNHLAHIAVRDGQRVNAGDYIGAMGSSGNTGGTVHLHEELWINGVRVDPDIYRTRDLPGTTGEGASTDKGTTPTIPKEWDEMATEAELREVVKSESRQALKIVGVVGGTMYLTGPGGIVHIKTGADLALLRRHIAATVTGEETFTAGQLQVIRGYLNKLA